MTSIFGKPFALSMGPQRVGSDLLYAYLQNRPDVCLPFDVKETFFFDRHYHRGIEFYEEHFNVQGHHALVAEVTTTLFDNADAPQRVFELFGADIKFICPLRDPVERSYAVYRDYLKYGIVKGSIEEAVEQAPQILYASRYADHLENWFKVFKGDAFEVQFYEDVQEDENAYFDNIRAFLGLSVHEIMPKKGIKEMASFMMQKIISKGASAPTQKDSEQKAKIWLAQRLLPEVLKLENLLGRTLPAWKK